MALNQRGKRFQPSKSERRRDINERAAGSLDFVIHLQAVDRRVPLDFLWISVGSAHDSSFRFGLSLYLVGAIPSQLLGVARSRGTRLQGESGEVPLLI